MLKKLIFFLSILIVTVANSQEGLPKKELLDMLRGKNPDTTLVDIYNELCWPVYSYDQPDSALYYGNKVLDLAGSINDVKRLSIAYRRMGIAFLNTGDIKRSIHYQEESYRLSEQINYTRGMYLALNNIGAAYLNNELFSKALNYFLKSLRYIENTNDYSNISRVYSNCGVIYRSTGDLKKSKIYFLKSNQFARLSRDTDVIISSYCSLSSVNRNMNMMDSAKYYLGQAGAFLSERNGTTAKFHYKHGWSLLFAQQGDYRQAMASFKEALKYAAIHSDQITVLINIAEQYSKLGDNTNALEHYKKAYDLSKSNSMYDNLELITLSMATVYEKMGKDKDYARYMKEHSVYKDSNVRINNAHQIYRQQLEFDFEKKQVADSIRFEEKQKMQEIELEAAAAKLNKERVFRIMLLAMLVLIIVFSAFIFNRFIITKRQKKVIEQQKQIVEIKNLEILDSINYAKRLQGAIIPQLSIIKNDLNADILYLPKDIIGGDFYFYEKHREHTFIAVCDCTGHGVPGALMSVVCFQALQKAIKEFGLVDPGEILGKTREIVITSLNAANQKIHDGMDCSLLAIHKKTGTIKWAGANNPLWIVTENKLQELKADKQPVAYNERSTDFTTHELKVKYGTTLYMSTDGYSDQFGGPGGKKYKTKTLKHYISTIAHLSPEKQVEKLQQNFYNWKGSLEQVDDVALAVIKM